MSINKANVSVFVACITVALHVVSSSAHASVQSDEINECRVIQDNAKRLACLDDLFGRLDVEKKTNKAIEASPVSTVEQTNNNQPEMDEIDKRAQALMTKKKESEGPFSSNTPRLSTNNKQATEKPVDSFGAESMSKTNANELEEIQTSITGLVEDSRGYLTITLSNEQVWRQTESSRFGLKKGQTVIIEKGAFQSYYLSKPNNNRRIRVKRIK
jgi:hypothetical protein